MVAVAGDSSVIGLDPGSYIARLSAYTSLAPAAAVASATARLRGSKSFHQRVYAGRAQW